MAFSRSRLYPENEQIFSGFAKAFGHPARTIIIRKLAKDGPCRVTEILKNHPISQPALSVHLKILRKAHLVKCWEKFPHTYYELEWKYFRLASKYFKQFFKNI